MSRALNPTNGFHVYGWMRTEFDLKGAELLTYALVHQFSQADAGFYKGGVNYLASWLGCSYNSASKYLKALVAKKLIVEMPGIENNVRYCHYTLNFEVLPQNLGEGYPKFGDRIEDKNINISICNKESRSKFQKPTLSEVSDYCRERGNRIDPAEFIDHYESNGWMVGKNHMKDWRAAVRTWEKREKEVPQRKRENTHKESVLEHNLKVMDELFGTDLHKQAYGNNQGGDIDEQ